nr:tyrosine-type recombinase/integrase [Halalkalicoccus jeotgali]
MNWNGILEEFEHRRNDISRSETGATASRYVRNIKHWKTFLEESREKTVWDAQTADLRAYTTQLSRDDYAPTTITTHVSAVSVFYQECAKMTDIFDMPKVPENPYEGFDKDDKKILRGDTKKSRKSQNKEGIQYLSPDEIDTLCRNVPSPIGRNELLIRLQFNTGMRVGELASIEMDEIDRQETSIYIPSFKSKSPSSRTVYYNPEYIDFLMDEYLDGYRGKNLVGKDIDTYLFPTQTNPHVTTDYINQIVKGAAESADLQSTAGSYAGGKRKLNMITSHTLRHSYAVQAIKSGINPRNLQALLGHEKLETTEIYMKMAEEDHKKAARAFTPY